MKIWSNVLALFSLAISSFTFSAQMPVEALQDGTVAMGIHGDIEVMMGENLLILPNLGKTQETLYR